MYPPLPKEYYYPQSAGQPSRTAPPPPPPPPVGVPMGVANQYYPQAPSASQMESKRPQPWSTGLCSCTDDCGNCCMTCWCPCITFGRIAEIVDRGSSSCGTAGALYALLEFVTCCHWIYSCSYRKKLRAQYDLPPAPCNDCLVHLCCDPCALCQEYRELKNRGFDMIIGWQANMERQARVPPAMQGGMMR